MSTFFPLEGFEKRGTKFKKAVEKKLTEGEISLLSFGEVLTKKVQYLDHAAKEMEAVATSSSLGSVSTVSKQISMADIMAAVHGASAEDRRRLFSLLQGEGAAGITPVIPVGEPTKAAATVAKKEATVKKAAPKKAPSTPPSYEGAPTAAHYRLAADQINTDLCLARKQPPMPTWDKRWSPSVFYERQCTQKAVLGEDLCQKCCDLRDKETAADKFKNWCGLVTEDPLDSTHMIGTAWAVKCVWVGSPVGSPAPSDEESSSSSSSSSAGPAGQLSGDSLSAAPVMETPVKAKEAKEAKEAKAEAPKKAVKPRTKKAEKAAVVVPTPPELSSTEVKVVTTEAKVTTTEPVTEAGELKMLGGDFYWVVKGNVYEYDQIEETPGDFVGRLRADETIDVDAEPEGEEESDAE